MGCFVFKRLILWEGDGEMYLESHLCCFINKLSSSQWWIHCSFPFPHNNQLVNKSTWRVDCCVPCVTKFQSVIFYSVPYSTQLNVHFVHESLLSSLQHFFGGRTWQKKEVGGLRFIQRICLGKKYFEEKTFEIARFKL